MAIYQIIYISAGSVVFTEDALKELLAKARANNEAKGLSGLLLYHEGSFIQVLEGERAAVRATYVRINQDSRHSEVQVLFEGDVEERTFEGWSMGYVPANGLQDLPEGFHPFLVTGFRTQPDTPSMARKAMAAFKKGRWRAHIAA